MKLHKVNVIIKQHQSTGWIKLHSYMSLLFYFHRNIPTCAIRNWMHQMKPKVTKTIRNALIISIGLHIVLVFILSGLHLGEPNSVEDITQLEISEVRSQRALRTLKRERYIPPKFVPIKQRQLETAINPPVTSLPAAAPIVHRNPVTLLSSFSLPTPRTLGIYKSGINSTVPSVNYDKGNRLGAAKFDPEGVFRGTKHQSFKPPVDNVLPSVSDLPLPEAILTRVAQHILTNRTTDIVDIVFIIDASGSMKDNINAVESHLNRMTDLFQADELDFTLGIVVFRENILDWNFEVFPQTRSIARIKKVLAQVKCRGGEKAIDALIRAADEVVLRQNADVHFILITDEYVSGNYSARDVLSKMRNNKIKVDVVGLNEPFQKFITRSTGGIWLPISNLGMH